MKSIFTLAGLSLILSISFVYSCKKDKPASPSVTTSSVSAISSSAGVSGGNVTDEGSAPIISRGICWSILANPTTADNKTIDGAGIGIFVSNLTGLIGNTLYYVRAYATNSGGTSYGTEVSFTTLQPTPPVLATSSVSLISTTSAFSGGSVTSDGGSPITVRGVCWSTANNPNTDDIKTSDGFGIGNFVSSISGLLPNTVYYLRAYATNTIGTGYGDELILKTYLGTVTDIEGNPYYTVKIGSQIWMAENLKTTKYNDGTDIPLKTGTEWATLTTPGYCWYNNDVSTYKATFGALYNWYTVNTGILCPLNWHVSTIEEWGDLVAYLVSNGYGYGGIDWQTAKSMAATSGWTPSSKAGTPGFDQASNNITGFTGRPTGMRSHYGWFADEGTSGIWWHSNEQPAGYVEGSSLNSNSQGLGVMPSFKQTGFSVRCIKDNE
jgi:uncharacterized protein (TIGR02145 family)